MMNSRYIRFRQVASGAGVGLCLCAIVSAGCAERNTVKAHVKSIPWAATARKAPVVPKLQNTSYQEAALSPDLSLEIDPPPSSLAPANSAPARPARVISIPTSSGNNPKFQPLSIAPQLTAEETQAAQQQTESSLSIAERHINAARGRNLNPVQSDLVSKVRSFISEAQEAAHNGDWTRASNAAKKAQVLSEELTRSL